MHPLQEFAQCLMVTCGASNENALLVHMGTIVHVIPGATGHRLLTAGERQTRMMLWLKTFWVWKPFLAMPHIS